MFSVPAEMVRGERPVQPEFEPSERLYRRFRADAYRKRKKGGKPQLALYVMDLPDTSVVRSGHGGKMEFALYDDVHKVYYADWGVCSLSVREIPPALMSDGCAYTCEVSHAPHKNNYHHSEIRIYDKYGAHVPDAHTIPPALQKYWQNRISRFLVVDKIPSQK